MPGKMFFTLFVLLALSSITPARADDAPACVQLDEKAVGEMAKYSISGEANGPVFFSSVGCAMEHRNRKLCAMEMVTFDATAKVYDFITGEEIAAAKAYFWLDAENIAQRVPAFDTRESAEKFGTGKEGGMVVDYSGLAEKFTGN